MEDTKRQDLPNGLWIVATPIGNLGDLSPRAHGALKQAHVLLCEDTRRGAQLLNALGIGRPEAGLHRLDAHTSPEAVREWVRRIRDGENMALITDAGTPAVSDPGAELVLAAREAGVAVTPVPGASAVMALLSVAGFKETRFAFRGFFPRKKGDRNDELDHATSLDHPEISIWFESPERICSALDSIDDYLSDESKIRARIVVAKELTKLHERVFAGTIEEVKREVEEHFSAEGARGEWCFATELPKRANSSDWVKTLQCLIDAQVSASVAARQVSQHFGVAKNEAYRMALALVEKKSPGGD